MKLVLRTLQGVVLIYRTRKNLAVTNTLVWKIFFKTSIWEVSRLSRMCVLRNVLRKAFSTEPRFGSIRLCGAKGSFLDKTACRGSQAFLWASGWEEGRNEPTLYLCSSYLA